jgi:hypothetical protein
MLRFSALLILFILALTITAWAQNPYDDEATPAGWAWKQIRNDQTVDFNLKCQKTFDPHVSTGWDDPCRQIPSQFLVSVLTKPEFRDHVPRHRVGLRGARINGTIDLMDAEVTPELRVNASRIDGNLLLTDSHWTRSLSLEGSTVVGVLSAERMRTDHVILNNALFGGEVGLSYAKIEGSLEIEGSTFAEGMVANSLSLGASLFMNNHAKFGGALNLGSAQIGGNLEMQTSSFTAAVNLNDAKVGSVLGMSASSFAGAVNASRLRVEGSLFISNHATFGGAVNLNGAKIGGVLDISTSLFTGAIHADRLTVDGGLLMRDHAAFGGAVHLRGALVGSLEMDTSSFKDDVNADSIVVSQSLFMRDHATFGGGVNLNGAKIGGDLEMDISSFAGEVNANSLSVANALLMRDHAKFGGEVYLVGAKVGRVIEMGRSVFAKAIHASRLDVAGGLFMSDHARFADLVLNGAKIGNNLEMQTSTFTGTISASGLSVEGSLLMGGSAHFNGEVNLVGAKVGSNLEMDGSSFTGGVTAESLSVAQSLLMWHAASFRRPVNLIGAKIGGILDLSGATAAIVDLSGADARELLISGLAWWCAGGKAPIDAASGLKTPPSGAPRNHWPLGNSTWRTANCSEKDSSAVPYMHLRNFHARDLQDSPDAWPPSLDLEGLHYDRLGSIGGIGHADMRARSPEDWIDWLERDRTFSSQPYAQLSSVLAVAGRRTTADTIQFAGRERERSEAWAHGDISSWTWLTALSFSAGYGIGIYTFRVLWWVIGFTALGFVFLSFSSNARTHSTLWRLGASLHRLLPIVKLSKEYEDFFDNPSTNADWPRNFNRIQVCYFAVHAILGWVLGLILLAAMSGLIQKG